MEGEIVVFVVGDLERVYMCKVEEDGGIYYYVNLVEVMVSYDVNFERLGIIFFFVNVWFILYNL